MLHDLYQKITRNLLLKMALGLSLFGSVGCVNTALLALESGLVCPEVSVLGIAQTVYRFQGGGQDPAHLRYKAELGHDEGECALKENNSVVEITIPSVVRVVAGPRLSKNDKVTVLTTLFDPKDKVIARTERTINVMTDIDDMMVGEERYYSWNNQILAQLNGDLPENFSITFAIKLQNSEIERVKKGELSLPFPQGLDF